MNQISVFLSFIPNIRAQHFQPTNTDNYKFQWYLMVFFLFVFQHSYFYNIFRTDYDMDK